MGFLLFLVCFYISVGLGTELELRKKADPKPSFNLEALKRVFTWPQLLF
jgi:hypothetical protein